MTGAMRRGVLLPAALAAMVIIGLAASAAMYIGRTQREMSSDAVLQTSVLSAADEAERIALEILASQASRLVAGQGVAGAVRVSNTRVRATARLTRLARHVFALAVVARDEDAGGRMARRSSSLLLRLRPSRVAFPAALTLTGSAVPPTGLAEGSDHASPQADCAPDSATVPDVLHPFPSGADSVELDGLRERASVRPRAGARLGPPVPVVRDGECDTASPSNWGDPSGATACAAWLPIIHAPGDLDVVGGAGQGVLLVDGDLELSGGFEFTGAVIVAGTMTIGPGGAQVSGGVRAAAVVDASGASRPPPFVLRSSCALREALLAAGRLVPVADRPWAPGR